jgi:glucosamine kinase
LGYILADEGSGNWLGRQLLKAFMNETMPDSLSKKFVKKYNADRNTILDKVYKQKQPALYPEFVQRVLYGEQKDAYL